jgi:hypothetical protein
VHQGHLRVGQSNPQGGLQCCADGHWRPRQCATRPESRYEGRPGSGDAWLTFRSSVSLFCSVPISSTTQWVRCMSWLHDDSMFHSDILAMNAHWKGYNSSPISHNTSPAKLVFDC